MALFASMGLLPRLMRAKSMEPSMKLGGGLGVGSLAEEFWLGCQVL